MEYYELDPCHFYTAPVLTWRTAIKMTGVELQLLEDPDMSLLVDEGIRGGISQKSNRYAKANNPYFRDYDTSKESTWMQLIYMVGQ